MVILSKKKNVYKTNSKKSKCKSRTRKRYSNTKKNMWGGSEVPKSRSSRSMKVTFSGSNSGTLPKRQSFIAKPPSSISTGESPTLLRQNKLPRGMQWPPPENKQVIPRPGSDYGVDLKLLKGQIAESVPVYVPTLLPAGTLPRQPVVTQPEAPTSRRGKSFKNPKSQIGPNANASQALDFKTHVLARQTSGKGTIVKLPNPVTETQSGDTKTGVNIIMSKNATISETPIKTEEVMQLQSQDTSSAEKVNFASPVSSAQGVITAIPSVKEVNNKQNHKKRFFNALEEIEAKGMPNEASPVLPDLQEVKLSGQYEQQAKNLYMTGQNVNISTVSPKPDDYIIVNTTNTTNKTKTPAINISEKQPNIGTNFAVTNPSSLNALAPAPLTQPKKLTKNNIVRDLLQTPHNFMFRTRLSNNESYNKIENIKKNLEDVKQYMSDIKSIRIKTSSDRQNIEKAEEIIKNLNKKLELEEKNKKSRESKLENKIKEIFAKKYGIKSNNNKTDLTNFINPDILKAAISELRNIKKNYIATQTYTQTNNKSGTKTVSGKDIKGKNVTIIGPRYSRKLVEVSQNQTFTRNQTSTKNQNQTSTQPQNIGRVRLTGSTGNTIKTEANMTREMLRNYNAKKQNIAKQIKKNMQRKPQIPWKTETFTNRVKALFSKNRTPENVLKKIVKNKPKQPNNTVTTNAINPNTVKTQKSNYNLGASR